MENLKKTSPEVVKALCEMCLAYQTVIDFDNRYSVCFKVTEHDEYYTIKTNWLMGTYQEPFTNPVEAKDEKEFWNYSKVDVYKKATLSELADIIHSELDNVTTDSFKEDDEDFYTNNTRIEGI